MLGGLHMENQNLVACKACGNEIAKGVKKCPHCGKDQRNFFAQHKIISAFLVIYVLAAAGSTLGEDGAHSSFMDEPSSSESSTTTLESSTTTQKPETVPTEYKNALKKAESYSKIMHMSKMKIYDQLTSEYGEKFPPEAAQYAVDNLKADYNANALAKAKEYQKTMNMSKSAIYDQLTSEYGEKFTPEEAQYAIDNLGN